MSMITATTWVPRGYAASHPSKYEIDDKEYARIAKLAKLQLEDAEEDLENAKLNSGKNGNKLEKSSKMEIDNLEVDDDLKEYDLENYDDDDDSNDEDKHTQKGTTIGMFGNSGSLAYHQSNEDDPYITFNHEDARDDDDEEDEREDLQILPTDNLLLAARIEDELAHLEVYVYEDDADNLYVHHDIMLPAYPLCVEWLNYSVGSEDNSHNDGGNFAAIGTMDPDIEVWNLDTVDCMYPNAILGQGSHDVPTGKKKKKLHKKKINEEYHVDAVLSLSANQQHRNLLASSSADTTVKLWDLQKLKCAKSYKIHEDKVCATAWHPNQSTILLTGSYDKSVAITDMRAPDSKVPRWHLESDVEMVKWDPHQSELFYVTTEDGTVRCFDIRTARDDKKKALWTLQAHDEGVSAFDINPIIPGFLVTGSTDKKVKIWNVESNVPSMVVSRDLDVGKVFSATFAPDKEVGFRLAIAGGKGNVQIWDTSTNAAVRRIFGDRLAPSKIKVEDRLVGVQESDDESDDEDGKEGELEDQQNGNHGEDWEDEDDESSESDS